MSDKIPSEASGRSSPERNVHGKQHESRKTEDARGSLQTNRPPEARATHGQMRHAERAYPPSGDISTSRPDLKGDMYNMTYIEQSLPQTGSRAPHVGMGNQPFHQQQTGPMPLNRMSQMPQYTIHQPAVSTQPYYVQQGGITNFYGAGHFPPTHQAPPSAIERAMPYYANQGMMGHPQNAYYYPQMSGMPDRFNPAAVSASQRYHASDGRLAPAQSLQPQGSIDPKREVVRGPPRKPRQSGFAIWIGNLPPQTELMSLVQHVCKESSGLISLFLISKSNCAFANFQDENACTTAQQQLHDSKFKNVRLVSRLRKSTAEGAGGTSTSSGPSSPITAGPRIGQPQPIVTGTDVVSDPGNSTGTRTSVPYVPEAQDRFFILKSLTVEDLLLSVKQGVWATQSHNEEVLSQAFKTSENVYLIFSANKSGEYFGYARMATEIDQDPEAAIEFAPRTQRSSEVEGPKPVLIEATEFVPKGRVLDDSARGTIFWEIDVEEVDSSSDGESETPSVKSAGTEEAKVWGKPFRLVWLSTNRLPFYRTRGLRNPWNSNRDIKIARDGTELEPTVGRRLIGLFDRQPTTTSPTTIMTGYPPMQSY